MEAELEATEKRLLLWPTALCLGEHRSRGAGEVTRSDLFIADSEGPFDRLVSAISFRLHYVVPMGWWDEAFDLLAVYANHVGNQLFHEHGCESAAGAVCAYLVEHESNGHLSFRNKASFRSDLEQRIANRNVGEIASFLKEACLTH